MSTVKEKDVVRVHYTGKLANGDVFDSSVDKEPLEFTMGEGQIIPGFEKGLMDMAVNEKKTVEIPMADAYGPHSEELIQDVPKAELPAEVKPEVGMQLMSKLPDGREIPLVITEVAEDKITVDANHPLAGKDLTFDLELVEIK
jgi:FKBP-type peptidyl-prolyl cis-trans isomerase SlpA